VIDSGAGEIRYVRATGGDAGTIYSLKLQDGGGNPVSVTGAQDLRLVESAQGNYLYLALTPRHVVYRITLPSTLATLDSTQACTSQVILGTLDTPGLVDTAQVTFPDAFTASAGTPKAATLLNAPVSLDFDAAGDLLVADAGRVRLVEAAAVPPGASGNVYTIAGGFETNFAEGDARLAAFPTSAYMNVDPTSGNVLIADPEMGLIRKLWTGRSFL
jgi:hypothetical protein